MNTTTGSKYFHNWLRGDFRTDGFESEWKRDFMRRSAEEKPKIIMAPQIAIRRARHQEPTPHRREIVRNSQRRTRERLKAAGLCVDCGSRPVKESKTLCQACITRRVEFNRRKRAA